MLLGKKIVTGMALLAVHFAGLLAAGNELTDQEKMEAFQDGKEAVKQRLKAHWQAVPEDKKMVIDEVMKYNSGKSDQLRLVSSIMSAESDPLDQLYPVEKLKIDTQTLPLFEGLLEESADDVIRAKIIWRVRDEALSGNLSVSDKMNSLLEGFLEDETIDSNIRRASKLTLRQISEMEAQEELVSQSHNTTIEPAAEVSLTSLVVEETEVIEEVTEAAIEKTVMVATSEPIEEDVEQSSNWLLWLIGALVAVGVGILIIRPKN